MSAYYNEIDHFAAACLRKLIKAGHIAPGEVDERSIAEVKPDDLRGFTQCHFFAGIGVWSYALRAAGWPDDTRVWTGSCPCQSFSASGKRGGFSDKRHLWPAWFRLIRECRPDTILGEQVASADGLAWFDVVSADLEGEGYAVGAADLCAAGFGAPHIRSRLYFVADAYQPNASAEGLQRGGEFGRPAEDGGMLAVADAARERCDRSEDTSASGWRSGIENGGELGHAGGTGLAQRECNGEIRREAVESSEGQTVECRGYTNGFWADAEWLWCRDQKYRPVEPGTFPLVTGASNRVGRLRGYGNALCAPVAKGFIKAYMESMAG